MNTSVNSRSGTLMVGNQALTITQDGAPSCAGGYALGYTTILRSEAAWGLQVSVSAPGWCSWTATSNVPWITVSSPISGVGTGFITYHIAANNSTNQRMGTLTIADQTLTVTQNGNPTGVNQLSVSAPPSAIAGMPFRLTATAFDVNGNTVTNFADSLHLTSTDRAAALSPDAAPTNGVGTFYASLVSSGVWTVTATDSLNPSITGTSASITVSPPSGLSFIPITPCRVADTRSSSGFTGAFGPPFIGGGASGRSFTIPSSACGIPATAQAYSLNVAVVPHGPLGYVTLWPTGQTQPVVATLNSIDGRIKSNAAVVPAGTGGAVSVYATNDTDVILDINGYFVPATTTGALAFYPVTPCRVADTRNGTLLSGPFVGGSSRTLPMQSSSCGIPSTAQAYSLNFTVVAPAQVGYITAWPTGQGQPTVATLNALPPLPLQATPVVVANAAIVPAGAGGSISVFATNTTDLVVDINGYFAAPGTGGLSLYNLPPCRVLDTRHVPFSGAPFSGAINVNVLGSVCGGTPSAQAYVLNTTVVPQVPLGYLTMWPHGTTQPTVATLNALDGAITNNMAIVPTSDTEVSAFATNPTQLIFDMFGYFAP